MILSINNQKVNDFAAVRVLKRVLNVSLFRAHLVYLLSETERKPYDPGSAQQYDSSWNWSGIKI